VRRWFDTRCFVPCGRTCKANTTASSVWLHLAYHTPSRIGATVREPGLSQRSFTEHRSCGSSGIADHHQQSTTIRLLPSQRAPSREDHAQRHDTAVIRRQRLPMPLPVPLPLLLRPLRLLDHRERVVCVEDGLRFKRPVAALAAHARVIRVRRGRRHARAPLSEHSNMSQRVDGRFRGGDRGSRSGQAR
jgi:hypothetical protein